MIIRVLFGAVHSESDWKMNQKAVLCALQTYDNYQKEQVGSVKYIAHKAVSTHVNEINFDNSESVALSVVTTAEVTSVHTCRGNQYAHFSCSSDSVWSLELTYCF